MTVLTGFSARAEKLTIERIFAAPDLSGPSLRSPQVSPDGRLITYLRGKDSNKDRFDLWAYDVRAGQHRLLVDSAALTPEERPLSAEEAQRRERQRTSALSGIIEYQFSSDARYLLVPLSGDLYVYDLKAPPKSAVRRVTNTESYETDARFSPHAHYVSFIRDQNLYIYELASGHERAITQECRELTSCGVAEFIAQEEMDRDTGYWWSPDEKHIAFTKVDESPVAEVERFEIYADSAKLIKQRYPAAGQRNAKVELYIASTNGASTPVRVDLGSDPDFYLARVDWFPNSKAVAVQKQSRDQKTLSLLKVDVASGSARGLLVERSEKWVDLHNELTFLERSPRFIWASTRTGFKHLYLYDDEGQLIRPLTSGDWVVEGDGDRAVRGVDEQRGVVYFMANAQSPLERHLYSTSLSDAASGITRITDDEGWHSVKMSRNAKVFLDTFSTPDAPPSVTLRSADGKALTTIVDNKVTGDHPYAPYLPEHLPTEFGTLQASDGQTLHYQIIKPRPLVAAKRYPVIVDVYGGPKAQRVRRAWGGYPRSNEGFFRQYLAQRGYIIFTLDNRGSGMRGVKFETALYHRMSSVEVEDQLKGVEYLKSLPYVDPQRIGVFGWSYGGYMTLMCMMKGVDAFAAGVSGAPVTDWRLYDTHYTERFMGTPQDNPDGYADSNVLTHANKLKGSLLIMHGMADDNVLFTNSTSLFKKLQDLNKPFDVMAYPGSKHGLLRHADTGPHGYAMVERFFNEHLKTR
jgi:dipeptidyl-peptidase 4